MKLAQTLPALCIAALSLAAAPFASAQTADTGPKGDAAHGRKIYVDTGCYQCHGVEGTTGGPGPRLAPGPMDYDGFKQQLRKPRARMPIYTDMVMSDQDVADIYAYLRSQPKGKTAAEIPMLSR